MLDVLVPSLGMLGKAVVSTQSAWETTVEEYDFHKTGMTVPASSQAHSVDRPTPIQLAPFNRLLGYRYRYSAVDNAQLQSMITAYKQNIGNNTSLGGDIMAGEYNLANDASNFAVYMASRMQLKAQGSTFPANVTLNDNGSINPEIPQKNQGFLQPGYMCGVQRLDENLLHFKPGFKEDN